MKKRTLNAILSLLLAVAMVFGQPGVASAMEAVGVDAQEVSNDGEDVVAESVEVIGSADGEDKAVTVDYKEMDLSDARIQEKKELSPVISALNEMTADKDYVEGEVVFFADTEDEAAQIAECYGGKLVEFEYGVGVIEIEASVKEVVTLAADGNIGLPAVYPNVLYTINDGWESDGTLKEDLSEETAEEQEEEAAAEEAEEEASEDFVLPMDDEQLYATAPNDTYYASQWHHTTINTVEAWNASKGKDVTVAVIDTGVDFEHPDLKANVKGHLSTIDYAVDEDGYLYYSADAENGYDDNGHGTHCSGIIAATANNSVGVSGVAPEAKILGVKVLSNVGSGATADIVQGVIAATLNNVDVISMSLGGFYWDQAFQNAVNDAVKNGVVVIAAAGNEETSQKAYPAAYDNVIAVAATDDWNELTYFSNYGKWVDIAAPGYQILSTLPTAYTIDRTEYVATGYGYMSGTSMACPVVAGVTALMLGNNEELRNTNTKANVSKITKTLLNSCDPRGAYYYWSDDPNYYYPLVDAEASTYAVDNTVVNAPTIKFSQPEQAKNVVVAGEDEYFELKTDNDHAKIYYTTNGTKPSAKNGYLYTGKVYMPRSGNVTIKAVAVVGSKTSKVFSKKYKFDVKAEDLNTTCEKEMTVVKGKSIQLNVGFAPYYTSNQKLTWTSDDATGMIKVNKKGKVTANKKATAGTTATIKATTQDGTNLSIEFKVKVAEAPIDTLELNATSVNMSYWAYDSAEESYGLDMKAADGTKYVDMFQIVPKNGAVSTTQYLYKSSNTKVATVDAYGNVMAWAKGKATITVTANDGSGKKAKCKINVVNPIFNMYVTSSTGFTEYDEIPIGTGCKITLKNQINYGSTWSYYAPSNKKVVWTSSNPAAVSVNNSGKVTCSKNAMPGTKVTITATAKDGFGAKQEIDFVVTDKITKLTYVEGYTDTGYSAVKAKLQVGQYLPDMLNYINVHTANGTSKFYEYVAVETTNRDAVYRYYYPGLGTIIGATKPGKSKVIYKAMDGSNTKFTLDVTVTK